MSTQHQGPRMADHLTPHEFWVTAFRIHKSFVGPVDLHPTVRVEIKERYLAAPVDVYNDGMEYGSKVVCAEQFCANLRDKESAKRCTSCRKAYRNKFCPPRETVSRPTATVYDVPATMGLDWFEELSDIEEQMRGVI